MTKKFVQLNDLDEVVGIYSVPQPNLDLLEVEEDDARILAMQTNRLLKAKRALRDSLLAKTDWTQIPDNNLTADEVEAYRTYRQMLRELPEREDFLTMEIPTQPQ